MESPLKALWNVYINIFGSNTDKTAIKDIPDFSDLNLSKTDLSPDAINALKEGRTEADFGQREFEKEEPKKSRQPAVAQNTRTHTQTPSRSSIVKGEAPKRDDEEEQEQERTIGPK